jgi:hypothetical protein
MKTWYKKKQFRLDWSGFTLWMCEKEKVVASKGLVVTIRMLSGASTRIMFHSSTELASLLEERATAWVEQRMDLPETSIEVELQFECRILNGNATLCENGIADGAEVYAIVKLDPIPALVNSSDSD